MGKYVITGGTKGIGGKAAEIIRNHGHEVINIDIDNGDINADLGTSEGREKAISQVYDLCPKGLDGLICNAGIAGLSMFKPSYVLSVNFFGTLAIAEGLYKLLKMKRGNCAVTLTGTTTYGRNGKYSVVQLLTDCGDEQRIGRLVDSFEQESIGRHIKNDDPDNGDHQGVSFHASDVGNCMYLSSKVALALWVRRISSTWAAHGVNINAVGPGAVDTTIMRGTVDMKDGLSIFPIPALFGEERFMDPSDVAHVLAFLVLPGIKGMSGSIVYCDAGTNTVNNTERTP